MASSANVALSKMSDSSGNDISDTVFSLHESWLTEEECHSQLEKCVKDAGHWALETLKSRIRSKGSY